MTDDLLMEDRGGGAPAVVEEWENGLREDVDPHTSDGWSFHTKFDDGRRLTVLFGTRRDFWQHGEPSPSWAAILRDTRDRELLVRGRCAVQELRAARDGLDVRVGELHATGDLKHQELRFAGGDLAVRLRFVSEIAPGRIGTGKLLDGHDPARYIGWLCVAARSQVAGTLTVAGTTTEVSGIGYHDHLWGTVRIPELISEWHWALFDTGPYTGIITEAGAARGPGRVRTLMLGLGGNWLVSTSRDLDLAMPMTAIHAGRPVPEYVSTAWSTDDGYALVTATGPGGAPLSSGYRRIDERNERVEAGVSDSEVALRIAIGDLTDTYAARCPLYHWVAR